MDYNLLYNGKTVYYFYQDKVTGTEYRVDSDLSQAEELFGQSWEMNYDEKLLEILKLSIIPSLTDMEGFKLGYATAKRKYGDSND